MLSLGFFWDDWRFREFGTFPRGFKEETGYERIRVGEVL